MSSLRLAALALLAPFALVACDSGSSGTATPVVNEQPAAAPVAGVSPPSAEVMRQAEAALVKASSLAAEAAAHKAKGVAAERSTNRQAAVPHYQEAKPLFRKAMQEIEPFLSGDFDIVTDDQADRFMGKFKNAYSKWSKESAAMGKVPPK